MLLNRKKRWIGLSVLLLAVSLAAYRFVVARKGSSNYQAAQQALEQRDFRQASLSLKRHLEDFPSDPKALLLAARTARQQGDFNDAHEYLRRCASCNGPKD